ncbi:MAG: NAD/NADP octopine/nopaline dehydrogenase family protein [Muribaculum sp.]|nr:NAD/NADP octopine/nopaline dehydrogenase family protein [Muribaculum sp.]
MDTINNICICGGGSLGTVIAGILANKGYKVSILTGHPDLWQKSITVTDPAGNIFNGALEKISDSPESCIPEADVVLLCVPGFLIKDELLKIAPYAKPGSFVGSVFSSTGFFFEAFDILDASIHLWGFQRVPYIARVKDYGVSANLLGYKSSYNIAVERTSQADKELFRRWIEATLDRPTHLLNNYLEASLTNSNPLLHTSRLYTMFRNWTPGTTFPKNSRFYAEWSDDASRLLIAMDHELFDIIDCLPVSKTFLPPILEYYESSDAATLSAKLRSIESFKNIMAPMIKTELGWVPDFSSRYFTEDFAVGLKYIRNLAGKYNVPVPNIDAVYEWGSRLI